MTAISLRSTNHKFRKTNLVTIIKGGKSYDEMKCELCGVVGRRYGIAETVAIDDKKTDYVTCPKAEIVAYIAQKVEIVQCTAVGEQFSNLKPGSQHTTVPAPIGKEHHNHRGVWVQGVDEPVLLLHGEYKILDKENFEMAEQRTRRTRRDRVKVTAKPVVEEVEEMDEVEELEDEEEEEVVVERPARRERRTRGGREVIKADEDGEPEAEEEADEFAPLTLAAETTFGEFLEQLPVGVVFQLSKVKDGLFTIAKLDGVASAPTVRKASGGGLRGKAYDAAVLNPEWVQWREDWAAMTMAEKEKTVKKLKLKWDDHDNPSINIMRMGMAYLEHLGIEKYKPEFASRAARIAIRGE